jgi:uridine kinase
MKVLLLVTLWLGSVSGGRLNAALWLRGGQVQAPAEEHQKAARSRPFVVGVCGGSGSGKTTLTRTLMERLGADHCTLIAHDSYYKNFNNLTIEQRAQVNFDSPETLDSALLAQHLADLREGKSVDVPVYDYGEHRRMDNHTVALPKHIILVEGILIFTEACGLLDHFDLKVFVDTADDIRLIRRLRRDMGERQRSLESVIHQYFATVKPMHDMLVEPSKRHAQIIVPSAYGIKDEAVDMVVSRLRDFVQL